MTFKDLDVFIRDRMRMSHVYQPVMLMALLRHGGRRTRRDLAQHLLAHDESQIEYYEHIIDNMVGRVLRNHDIVHRDRREYSLVGYEDLAGGQVEQLIEACQEKLAWFVERRGARVWQHRKLSGPPLSGSLRYEILKKARFRCELCGVSADEKALEVDHILPRNHGGTDDPSNLQALCYSCNAMKRDKDDTDFRAVRDSYRHREEGCPFCNPQTSAVLDENPLAFALKDAFPVTAGHALVLPRRHTASYFDLGRPEINACNQLLQELKRRLRDEDSSIEGFNVGINDGETAGQTIQHCHIHLIPRRRGDVVEPRGGIRNVIPGKGTY